MGSRARFGRDLNTKGRFGALLLFVGNRQPGRRLTGFTLVELIMTMLIISILAVVVGPRFFSRDSFDRAFFAEELVNALRYARTVAMASGCQVRAQVDASGYELRRDANCASGGGYSFSGSGSAVWPSSGDGSAGVANFTPPTGFSATLSDNNGLLSGNTLFFSPDGTVRASAGGTVLDQATLVVTAGSGSRTVLIEGRTGYVR